MPCTRDVFNHHNKELVEIKWSCKGSAKLSEPLNIVETRIWLSLFCGYHDHGELATLPTSIPLPLSTCCFDSALKENCRPADFITTTLNFTVLGPSNYFSLRCGHVEKGHKSTEVQAPGLELWENWKQMIGPFPYPFLAILLSNTLHFCPPPLTAKTMKEQLNNWKQEHVWSVWSG